MSQEAKPLDCVEIDQLAPLEEIIQAEKLADRAAAMLTRLIQSVESEARNARYGDPGPINGRDRHRVP